MQTCAIYIRKSREDRDKPSHRLTVQREQLPAHAKAQGWAVEVYDDGHASAARGKTDDLSERGRLERDIRAGRVQVVLCIELSRLSRDDSMQDYVAWLHLCGQHGVKLATPARMLDPGQHSDWMLLLMEGGFSSVEMRVLQGRMKDGRDEAFRAGRWLGGRPPSPYIYDAAQSKPVVEPAQLTKMQKLWQMAETMSARAIAQQLKMPEIAVRRAISDDRLLIYQALRHDPKTGEPIPCDWNPVMDAEQAERIRSARRTRKTNGTRREFAALLSNLGLFYCGYCGRTVKTWHNSRVSKDGYRINYYGCQKSSTCEKSRMVAQPIVDEKVITHLFGTLTRLDELKAAWIADQARDTSTDRSAELSKQEAHQKKKKQNLVAAISEGIIEFADAKEQMRDIDAALTEIARQRKEIAAAHIDPPDWDAIDLTPDDFEALDDTDKRALITAVVARIEMHKSYLLITYQFPRDSTGNRQARIHLPPPQRGYKVRTATKRKPPKNK
jgi:DNA invertase Pin-like site-specific DNA recombinase